MIQRVPNLSRKRKDPQLVALGNAIRSIRVSGSLTQEQVALQAGIDRTYYGDIERGNNSVSVLHLIRIASALGITAGELLLVAAL
ncbi:helix-turn-helix domain-containing protein [Ramlibacter sp.]|uniref:helix-turn-helix domain-containing protein n=1 Tax=Ramlibacter sp. TaxID=1917967 RepID=UPI002FCACD08